MSTPAEPARLAALYARVSTQDQARGYSIAVQIDACRKAAAEHGYHIPDEFMLIDEGLTWDWLDRPGLVRLRTSPLRLDRGRVCPLLRPP